MKDNRFIENGESIVFDKYGVLKDGQHRLLAIIRSKKSYFIPIVRGVEPISMATYDTGKNRNAGDVLSINGFKNALKTAKFIKLINLYSHKKSKRFIDSTHRGETLTNQQVLEYCSLNYDWLSNITFQSEKNYKKQKPRIISLSNLSIIAYLIGGENPNNYVWNFLNEISGNSRKQETAANYLYTKLYNSKVNKEPLNFYWVLGMAIKGWNYYSDGNPSVKYFKFDTSKELPTPNKTINI